MLQVPLGKESAIITEYTFVLVWHGGDFLYSPGHPQSWALGLEFGSGMGTEGGIVSLYVDDSPEPLLPTLVSVWGHSCHLLCPREGTFYPCLPPGFQGPPQQGVHPLSSAVCQDIKSYLLRNCLSDPTCRLPRRMAAPWPSMEQPQIDPCRLAPVKGRGIQVRLGSLTCSSQKGQAMSLVRPVPCASETGFPQVPVRPGPAFGWVETRPLTRRS